MGIWASGGDEAGKLWETEQGLLFLRHILTEVMNSRSRTERGLGTMKKATVLGLRYYTGAKPSQDCVFFMVFRVTAIRFIGDLLEPKDTHVSRREGTGVPGWLH